MTIHPHHAEHGTDNAQRWDAMLYHGGVSTAETLEQKDRCMTRTVYDDMDDFTLDEVFYETGTMLGGALTAKQDQYEAIGQSSIANEYRDEEFRMIRDRRAGQKESRSHKINLIAAWNARRNALTA